jgi:rhomboid-like protein
MAMNMFVLHSFLPSAVAVLGKYDTLFLYLSGGVVSAYGSHMFKILKGVTAPSLGASGAIMALLGFVCTQYPDAKLGIVFIPGLTFTADTGIKCLVAVDTAGMVFGWKLLDHAAHLSGVLYGVLFSHAHHHLEPVRDSILNVWRQIRTLGRG